MNKLVEKIIDIYAQVGNFRITPYDGAIPVSEADAQAEKAVEDYTNAVIRKTLEQSSVTDIEQRALVEAWIEATGNTVGMDPLNAALKARGLEIKEIRK